MADETSILRAAEADLADARRLLDEHARMCTVRGWCPRCASLKRHLSRARQQVGLLESADPDMEAMF